MTTDTSTSTSTSTSRKAATVERLSDSEFRSFLNKMKNAGKNSESAVQRVFIAVWRDVACSHSLVRLNEAYAALTDNPFRTQFSAAIRALAGSGRKDNSADALQRTGYAPLAYNVKDKSFVWSYDKREARAIKDIIAQNYKDFTAVHFRAVKLAKSKAVMTWADVDAFRKRIESAKKNGSIHEKDMERLSALVLEIERLTNGK